MSDNKKPAIRFKGFKDDWEQRKLSEVLVSLQNNTLSRSELSTEQGNAKNVHYGDILVKFGEVLDITEEQLPMIADNSVITKYKNSFLKNGDVIVADTAEDETVGKCTEIAGLRDEIVISGLHTIPYRPLFQFSSGYLGYYMNSSAYHNQLLPLMQGIKVTSVSKSAMQNTDIVYPKSNDEQAAIGAYFKHLDHLITLHQRKYERLQVLKKAMLEKMFPKNGSKVPEIRFEGFTDDWEQRKLLNCVQKVIDFRGRTPKKLGMEWSDRGYLALSALNVKDGYIDFDQDVHYGDKTLYDKWMTGNELHQGQVIFTTEAPMGNVAQVPDNRRYILSQRTIAFEVNENIITENFLATILRTPAVFDTLTALSSGGTAKGVSQKSLATVDICIPQNLDEQIKLADYFSHLDHLITLHQRQLEKLQNIKKSMLEKMFV